MLTGYLAQDSHTIRSATEGFNDAILPWKKKQRAKQLEELGNILEKLF